MRTYAVLEMSDTSSLSSMAFSQSGSSSSMQSRVPESNDWQRGGPPEHLHPEQSTCGDSPTRTSSSMTSSSPSASSMTSSPRNSPNLIPTNGHKGGSRSPRRQSPAAKPFLPNVQIPGFVPAAPGYSHPPVIPHTMFHAATDHPSRLDKEEFQLENDKQDDGERNGFSKVFLSVHTFCHAITH